MTNEEEYTIAHLAVLLRKTFPMMLKLSPLAAVRAVVEDLKQESPTPEELIGIMEKIESLERHNLSILPLRRSSDAAKGSFS